MKLDQNQQSSQAQIAQWVFEARERLGGAVGATLEHRPLISTLADRIEHTLLKGGTSFDQIETLVNEAVAYGFRAVCVLPLHVAACRGRVEHLGGTTRIATVVNFPLAGSPPEVALAEARAAVDAGADDLDMVLNCSALRAGHLCQVHEEVAQVVEAAAGRVVKVICETGLLTPRQIAEASVAAEMAGAHYVKTSTGFGPRGASDGDIRVMRAVVGDRLGIKASGGIRDRAQAERLVEAGADLIGTSSGLAIVGDIGKNDG